MHHTRGCLDSRKQYNKYLILTCGLVGGESFVFKDLARNVGFCIDRSSRVRASIKNLWEVTIGIVGSIALG